MTDYWYSGWYWDQQWVQTPATYYLSNCTFTGTASYTIPTTSITTTQWYGNSYGTGEWVPIGHGSFEMANGPGSMNNRLWKQWNADYVKDKDEARRLAELEDERRQIAAHARVLQVCVTAATGAGQRLEAFAVTRLAEYNDDEWRTVEDAYQRAYEMRIEADRAAVRDAVEKVEAQRKAELLLVSILNAEQKREWLEYKRVTHVSASGRKWRLFPKWAGGVSLMDDTGEVRRATLCLHTAEWVPEADNMAGLLLSLRHGDEDHLISIANLSAGEWHEDELQIRRERRDGRGHRPAIHPDVFRIAHAEIQANAVRIDHLDAEEMPA